MPKVLVGKLAHYEAGKQRPKEEANPSRPVGSRLDARGNLLTSWACPGQPEDEQMPHLPARLLTDYTEALTGSWRAHPDSLRGTLLFQDCAWKPFPRWETRALRQPAQARGTANVPRTRTRTGSGEELRCPDWALVARIQLQLSIRGHVLPVTSTNRKTRKEKLYDYRGLK